jgi:hypothetical protein
VFVDGVLVPESSFQAIAVIVVVVGSDLVHRDPAAGWRIAARRSIAFFGTGAALALVWAVFLALNHSLGSFLQYYLIFGPGHDAAGAIPRAVKAKLFMGFFYLTIALVVLTLATVAWRLAGRRAWSARDWVTVAAAITSGLYQEKALGRFDGGHLLQTIGVALPLWILWAATILDAADGLVVALLERLQNLRAAAPLLRRSVTVACLLYTMFHVQRIPELLWHVPQNDKQRVYSLDQVPLVGYSAPNVPDPALVSDLTKVLDTYAGHTGTLFDNTNDPGYFYYLLGRAPASAFIHVSMAEPEYAQQVLIGQLRKSRPPLVAFDSPDYYIGLPQWDGPRNNVRHFDVAQYLLDGWTPVIRTHGVLFLLRNDLVKSQPAVPKLSAPPDTADPYFLDASCDWGDTPNFLDSKPAGQQLKLTVTHQGLVRIITVAGWAYDVAHDQPVQRVVVAAGGVIVGQAELGGSRPDVVNTKSSPASGMQGALTSGFSSTVSTTRVGGLRVYAELANGTAVPLEHTGAVSAKQLTTADGQHVPVVNNPIGSQEKLGTVSYQLGTAAVPAGTTLSSYQLARFGADRAIGNGSVLLADSLSLSAGGVLSQHLITANTMAGMGDSLAVRVGSCLQWHGYQTSTLYVMQTGGAPITGLTLSGVKD